MIRSSEPSSSTPALFYRKLLTCLSLLALGTGVFFVLAVRPALGEGSSSPLGDVDESSDFQVQEILNGLTYPTSMAFLPDGRLLILQKDGTMLIANPAEAGQETPIEFSSRLAALGAHRTSASGSGGGRTFTPAPVRTEAATVRRAERPETFVLEGAYPNSSRGRLTLSMDLSQAAEVTVEAYDVLGRRLRTKRKSLEAGPAQHLQLDGGSMASGMHFYRVRAEMASTTTVKTGQFTILE